MPLWLSPGLYSHFWSFSQIGPCILTCVCKLCMEMLTVLKAVGIHSRPQHYHQFSTISFQFLHSNAACIMSSLILLLTRSHLSFFNIHKTHPLPSKSLTENFSLRKSFIFKRSASSELYFKYYHIINNTLPKITNI